jgi:glycosyltransferase involved in cell wall biosynthesis
VRAVGRFGLRLSVIVTTYNSPRALALVLAGLARQTVRDFELVLADDGSGPETKAVLDSFARTAPFPVRHVWQPDEGFRKCAILNKAILAATGNYLVFFDGDCVAPSHTLAVHVRAAQPRRYLTGGKVLLSQELTDRLTAESVARGDLERIGVWWGGVQKRRRLIVGRVPGLRYLFDRNVKRPPGWRGENSSTFADYVHLVAGFDERFTYGLEDADFGHRLQAVGIMPRSLRYTAPVFHLEHPRPYVRPEDCVANQALYNANRAARMTMTPHGLFRAKPSRPALYPADNADVHAGQSTPPLGTWQHPGSGISLGVVPYTDRAAVPAVSVLVATRNRAALLAELLRSLAAAQAAAPAVASEIVVVDNGSGDETPTLLDRWAASSLGRVVLRHERPGKARALNSALSQTRGALLAFLDDDVQVAPNWLGAITAFFAAHAEYGAAMGRVLLPATVTDALLIERIRAYATLPLFDRGQAVCDWPEVYGCNMVVRRSVMDRTGAFDERLGPGASGFGEDLDLSRRIREAGFRIGYMPDAIAYHDVDPDRLTMQHFRERHLRLARSSFLVKPDGTWTTVRRFLDGLLGCAWFGLLGDTRRHMRARGRVIRSREILRLRWGFSSILDYTSASRRP